MPLETEQLRQAWRGAVLDADLPVAELCARGRPGSVSLVRSARYGPSPRQTLDIYVPSSSAPRPAPVAVFVHGGVWTSGASWQYAPFGRRLAEAGILAIVVQYTLYPAAASPLVQADEVSLALDWAFANCRSYGGDPNAVSLIGHSSGAHVSSLCLLRRRIAGRPQDSAGEVPTVRAFIGLCGVYDIQLHYAFEDDRGVALMSTMAPCCGPPSGWPALSPARLALDHGLDKGLSHGLSHGLGSPAAAAKARRSARHGHRHVDTTGDRSVPLPPLFLLASRADATVPWTASLAMHDAATAAGLESSLMLYDGAGHASFAIGFVGWAVAHPTAGPPESAPPYARDIISLVTRDGGGGLHGVPPEEGEAAVGRAYNRSAVAACAVQC